MRILKHNKDKKKISIPIITSITILIVVLTLTIGYSAFQVSLDISDISATVEAEKKLRVTGVTASNPVSDALSNYEDNSINSISSSLYLPNSNSTLTYYVTITNFGNVEGGIDSINGLPDNLTYSISNYTLNDTLCDDNDNTKCKLGSTSTLAITIGYAPNGYDSNNTTYVFDMNFHFFYIEYVAQIGNNNYDTLQDAIDAVPATNTETTIKLLKDTSEITEVAKNKNIILNLNNKVLSNYENNPVINNLGTLKIINGTITTDASTNGAVNNQSTGNLTVSGGQIIVTGGRQAIWNNKGTATIENNAYLISGGTERAAVQNVSGGTMTITSATVISTATYALNNAGTLTIGVKDGNINSNTPSFQGKDNGIYSTSNLNFYDGIVKSKTNPFNNISKVVDMEPGYEVASSTETINNQTYNVAYLAITKTVTFNPNGGTIDEPTRYIELNHPIGPLPTPIKTGYEFEGWFTNEGVKITENTIITDDVTYYAHWIKSTDVAKIGNTIYETIQGAINAVPTNNTQTTITILKNTKEKLTVSNNKNIIIDLNGKTVTNNGNAPVIVNKGTLTVTNGNLNSTAEQSIINNESGNLTINNSELVITSTKQAIYITGGSVEITGNSYLSSKTSGKPNGSNMERGTVHVVSGNLIITGGTIVGVNQQAVSNEGTVTIGTKDGNINTTTPTLIGEVYGIKSTGTFNFYDGIIKGKTQSINGTVTDIENNSTIIDSTETISGATYKTSYLN